MQQKHLFTIEEVVIETGIGRTNIYAQMKAKHPKAGARLPTSHRLKGHPRDSTRPPRVHVNGFLWGPAHKNPKRPRRAADTGIQHQSIRLPVDAQGKTGTGRLGQVGPVEHTWASQAPECGTSARDTHLIGNLRAECAACFTNFKRAKTRFGPTFRLFDRFHDPLPFAHDRSV